MKDIFQMLLRYNFLSFNKNIKLTFCHIERIGPFLLAKWQKFFLLKKAFIKDLSIE